MTSVKGCRSWKNTVIGLRWLSFLWTVWTVKDHGRDNSNTIIAILTWENLPFQKLLIIQIPGCLLVNNLCFCCCKNLFTMIYFASNSCCIVVCNVLEYTYRETVPKCIFIAKHNVVCIVMYCHHFIYRNNFISTPKLTGHSVRNF